MRESGGLDGFLALSVRGEDKEVVHYLINVYNDTFFVGTSRKVPSYDDQLFDSLEVNRLAERERERELGE